MSDNKVQISEQLAAMFTGTELTEDFTAKVTSLFEAAVEKAADEKASEKSAEMDAEKEKEVADKIEEEVSAMAERVNDYLTYVAEEWMERNALSIEQGIRTELSENFISQMINVFKENYVDLPEEKYDLIASLKSKQAKLEESLNAQIEKNMQLTKDLKEEKRLAVFNGIAKDLTDTQVERLRGLVEGIDYEDEESYSERLTLVKENYLGDKSASKVDTQTLKEEFVSEETRVVDQGMSSLVAALDRVNRM